MLCGKIQVSRYFQGRLPKSKVKIFFVGVRPESKANVTGVVLKLVRKLTPKTNTDNIPRTRHGNYELSRHLINAKEIFTWSNATPIRKQTDVGYVCCFCDAIYPEPAQLKQHTMESHDGINNSSFTKRRDLNEFHVKVDITGLNCKICKQDLDDLDKLIIHLKEDHKKRLFLDIKNHMIPFKFETSSLQCFICSSEFNKFKNLLEHMNIHCRNYICTVCEAGFINRRRLIVHSEKHKTGVFQCGICPEEFTTLAKRKSHVISNHKPIKNRNRCGHCNETFKDYNQKQRHLITVHNIRNQYNCNACDRTFPTRKAYRVHMQRDHLMERRFKCIECDKTFYCGYTLKCHLLKHSGLREFQCDICLKTYGRKSTLRDHLRIHADDRRFKCDHCGQAFVQKCSRQQIVIVSGEKAQEMLQNLQQTNDKTSKKKRKRTKTSIDDDKCMQEVEKHRNNMLEILFHSNATPIRFKGDIGYGCSFCSDQYPKPADLKSHTIEVHDEDSIKKVIADMRIYTVKLDVTALHCALCSTDIPTIEELMDHLINDHQRVIYTDIKNHMVPFKFDDDQLKCAICSEKFAKFRNLTEHMNTHFRNYVCDVCGAGFVNRDILRSHLRIHKTGDFTCDFCPKTFNTRVKKQSHINIVHKRLYMTRKCGYCNELFDDYNKKNDHLVKFHGVNLVILKCELCAKTFINQNQFRRHVRKDHLMERNYECEVCDMKFFSSENLRKHVLKHTGERDFHCSVCAKSFARKFTLQQHMRVHSKERKTSRTSPDRYLVISEPSESINFEDIDNDNKNNRKRRIKTESETVVRKKAKITIKTKKIKLKPIKELTKHHHNIKEVLQCSNTTPIHGKSDLGYLCCYCTQQFPDPADLKKHTIDVHRDAPKPTFFQKRDLQKFYVKVDITGLQCNICRTNIEDLDKLIDHLKTEHDRKIYTDVKNHMVPFKFDSEELKCFVCANVYTKFKMLLEHMHKHCRNFICECGAGFFNRRSYLNHQKSHVVGEFKCDQCDKVFDNAQKKNQHFRAVHIHAYKLNRCGYCNEKFAGYRTKAEHLRIVHGVGCETAQCQACEKSFCNKDSLRKHIKRHHLMENQHHCTLCEMTFFAKKNLAEHMVTHTKTRSFQCKVCFKRYGRQHTLREHMRIHNNDRRFKCEHCGMAFVQKCSWRRHMQTKHDEPSLRRCQIHRNEDFKREEPALKKGGELEKHKINMREILLNSNATPIRCRGVFGYNCCFCTQQFPEPADLKKHTLEIHDEKTKINFMKGKDLFKFHAKLDITDLKCNLCNSSINTVEELVRHLKEEHKKTVFMDIKNQVLPFKFDNERLRCFICMNVYHKFKSLLEHMNMHCRNYICEVCSAGFVNRAILAQHSKCHKLGTFNCDYCPKIFDTFRKKRSHEKCVHTHSTTLNKCGYCYEKFRDYRKKERHLAEVHGIVAQALKCLVCDKTFANQKDHTIHVKRLHLMDRRHKCPQCDMSFFSSSELKNHIVKHTGLKIFKCEICHKTYGRKKTLTEHLRIHADDRRFKCEHCGQTFVQKCSWRGHMRAKHGETV
ncbi:unnamed protein product, partial [Brenthis ino]